MVMAMVAGEERREEERREEDKGEKTRENKLPTVKLPACIHDMQKGDGGEGGQGRVVSGKGQILTTYRGPSSREREGGGGTHQGKGENPNPTRGGSVPMA